MLAPQTSTYIAATTIIAGAAIVPIVTMLTSRRLSAPSELTVDPNTALNANVASSTVRVRNVEVANTFAAPTTETVTASGKTLKVSPIVDVGGNMHAARVQLVKAETTPSEMNEIVHRSMLPMTTALVSGKFVASYTFSLEEVIDINSGKMIPLVSMIIEAAV